MSNKMVKKKFKVQNTTFNTKYAQDSLKYQHTFQLIRSIAIPENCKQNLICIYDLCYKQIDFQVDHTISNSKSIIF